MYPKDKNIRLFNKYSIIKFKKLMAFPEACVGPCCEIVDCEIMAPLFEGFSFTSL